MKVAIYHSLTPDPIEFDGPARMGFAMQYLSEGIKNVGDEVIDEYAFNFHNDVDVSNMWLMPKLHMKGPEWDFRKIVWNTSQQQNKKCLMVNGISLFDRFFFRFSYDGVNGGGDFLNENSPSDRSKKLNLPIVDWRKDGKHILIIGQVPGDTALGGLPEHGGLDVLKWINSTIAEIKKYTDRPIVFRIHHNYKAQGLKYPTNIPNVTITNAKQRTIDEDLKNCWAIVTYNSNFGAEAILRGIPVFALNNWSTVYDIAEHNLAKIEDPLLGDRTQWINNFCYTLWEKDDITSGDLWKHFKEGL